MAIQHQLASSQENFPVASKLLPSFARRPIMVFYDFARGADTISDSADMDGTERLEALQALEDALNNHYVNRLPPWARAYHSLVQSGVLPAQYGNQLLSAFKQDCEKTRYATMDELIDYCQRSAAPVGRVVLTLCRETQADMHASDQLCMALQLINHMQDVGADYKNINRIYMPKDFQVDAAEEELAGQHLSPAWRTAIDYLIHATQVMLVNALPLLPSIKSRRVRLEVALIHAIASKLCETLRHNDPLSKRVRLTRLDYALCMVSAVRNGWVR